MIEWWGPIVQEYYSGTETCGITALSSDEWLRKPGSVGKAILGIVKILGDDGNELPPGETGDIYFADGPKFEYHNDPDKTAGAYNDAVGQRWGISVTSTKKGICISPIAGIS
jgi:long-chain acyl-CoA synthetase